MAAPTPLQTEILQHAASRLLTARKGERGAIIDAAAADTGLSRPTVYRHLQRHLGALKPRKRRGDAGSTALTQDEAHLIAAYLTQTRRANGKYLADLEAAVNTLRANGEIIAGRVDPETGEYFPLSISAINRALKHHRCHPEQLRQPTPKVSLRSEHPNHLWQIDPSLCVLYYLTREEGLRVAERDEFYKNKPKNLARIEHDRVWRYVIVDHTSSAVYVEYVLGAESGTNLAHCAINAMQPRGHNDPFHGVPRMVMLDPGSANTGAVFRNLCAGLGIDIWINQPKRPWAKGSVETHNDIVECEFEHRLKFHRVGSLQELNDAAWRWMRSYNATARHSRHGMTRYGAWMTITADQLRLPPDIDTCRSLAMSAPVERVVTAHLRVHWRGRQYDVSQVPGVIVGGKVTLARNAWSDDDSAHVLGRDEAGYATHWVVPERAPGEYGFLDDAVPLGEYRRPADTEVDTNRKRIEQLTMDTDTDEAAAAKRKAGALPFGGRIDPYRDLPPEVAHVPRSGTPLQIDAPKVVTPMKSIAPQIRAEFAPLNHVEAAMRLKPLVEQAGHSWTPDMYARTAHRWPDGVPVAEIETWAAELVQPPRNGLRVVDGGMK